MSLECFVRWSCIRTGHSKIAQKKGVQDSAAWGWWSGGLQTSEYIWIGIPILQVRASSYFAGEVQLLERKTRDLRECCDTWLTHLCMEWVKDKTPIYPEGQIIFIFFLGEIQGNSVGNTGIICRFTALNGLSIFPCVSWGLQHWADQSAVWERQAFACQKMIIAWKRRFSEFRSMSNWFHIQIFS